MKKRLMIGTVGIALSFALGTLPVLRSDDPAQPPTVTAGLPGPAAQMSGPRRVFLKAVPPTGRGNTELRVDEGPARVVSLNTDRLGADQSRYAADVAQAQEVVTPRGRQAVRRPNRKDLPPARALNLEPNHEEELYPFEGIPSLSAAEEEALIKNSIMITDLGVVEDSERTTGHGPWTFGTVMANLANRGDTGIEPAEFVRRWLTSWEEDQTINGLVVKNRKAGIRKLIIDPWQRASGGPGKPLDLTKAPFRLLAIGSRLDLRNNLVLGAERIGGGGAGEARFVFCAFDATDAGKPALFTVIFEYQVKRKNFHDVRDWAEQWYALKDIPVGTTRYNRALQRITDQFAGAGTDPESPPNKSALSQLRTNEIALDLAGGSPKPVWEIREFRIDTNGGGYLRQVTTKQTPDLPLNNTASLASYVNGSQADIVAQEHMVPVEFPPRTPFLSGSALTPPDVFWNAPGLKAAARHPFSLGTCSACHAGETFPKFVPDDLTVDQPPPHFTHIRPRRVGSEARLSPFLTGKYAAGKPYVMIDPVDPTKKRPFNDLGGRAYDLYGLVRYGAIYEKDRIPTQMVH